MKNNTLGRLLALALAAMMLFAVVGCQETGNNDPVETPTTADPTPAPTEEVPAGVIAAGSPCKVIREITEDDLLEEKQ